ncbi:hypothetical protein DRP04_01090 [Archaeoglobales archaeon]|nr:MAG: hypothetical protein DRP04_01090 [Archaeoglobales archaeon]
MLAKPESLSRKGKLLAAANLLLIVLMFSIAAYYHSILPEKVPTHFGIEGKPNAYGSKDSLLVLPFAFSLAQVIILVVVKLRFTLVNKYPFMINLPAFYANLTKLPVDKRGRWVNRYFEALLQFSLGIGIYLAILELNIYEGIRKSKPACLVLPIRFCRVLHADTILRYARETKQRDGEGAVAPIDRAKQRQCDN